MNDLVNIALLAATPADRATLDLDGELDRIRTAIRLGSLRDRFNVDVSYETSAQQLIPTLLEANPTVVHFSGHGMGADGLMFEGDDGTSQPVSGDFLRDLFSRLPNVRCVVLNACYSAEQAQAIAEHVDGVIGMSTKVSDTAATEFSRVWYQAVAEGCDLARCFQLAVLHLQTVSPTEASTPVWLGTDAAGATALAALPERRGEVARKLYEAEYLNLARSISALLDDAGCGSVVEEAFGEFVVSAPAVPAGEELGWLQGRVSVLATERSSPAPPPGTGDATVDRVLAAIRSLDATTAQVMLKRYYNNLTDDEIAAAVGIAVTDVAVAITNGLAAVDQYLKAQS
jgi:hypothetical protein